MLDASVPDPSFSEKRRVCRLLASWIDDAGLEADPKTRVIPGGLGLLGLAEKGLGIDPGMETSRTKGLTEGASPASDPTETEVGE